VRATILLLVVAASCFALATSDLQWRHAEPPRTDLYLDLSASTRGAWWRQLERQAELEALTTGRIYVFSSEAVEANWPVDVAEIASRQTRLEIAADADVAVVLTDGQLEMTSPLPVHVVLDPALDQPADRAAKRLFREGERVVRETREETNVAIEPEAVTFDVAGRDRWPENDKLTVPAAVDREPAVLVVTDRATPARPLRQHLAAGGLVIYATPDVPTRAVEALLPITFEPPKVADDWVILVDVSGSTADRAEAFHQALQVTLDALPEAATVRVGAFASGVTWLDAGAPLPTPRGPTNLDHALAAEQVVAADQVLLITDAAAAISDPPDLAKDLHVLHLGDGPSASVAALATTVRIVGNDLRLAAEAAVRAVVASELQTTPTLLRLDAMETIVTPWRAAWPKEQSKVLAREPVVAASWQVGPGRVVAVPATVSRDVLDGIAREQASAVETVDVEWEHGPKLAVRVQTTTAGRVVLHLGNRAAEASLVGPGLWRAMLDAPREAGVAVVQVDGEVVERRAVADAYAEEFVAIGNNRSAAEAIASRTGGSAVSDLVDLRLPQRQVATKLTPWFAMIGSVSAVVAAWRLAGPWRR
jgi:hypothetical protein